MIELYITKAVLGAFMPFYANDLYKIKKKDMKRACQVLGEAFQEDPTWVHVIPDETERKKKLPIIFEYLMRYSLKYGHIYAPTEELEGVISWVPDTTVEVSVWRLLRSGAFIAAFKMGRETGKRIEVLFKQIDNDRREHMRGTPYLYIQVVGVLPGFQGQGLGRKLLKAAFAKADTERLSVYLETETEKNMQMYLKYGFKILKEAIAPEADFQYWEMVRKPQ